jgi:hypothetical protein
MRWSETFNDIVARFADLVAAQRRRSDFVCGDCERMERCGRPPTKDCVIRAAQMERGDWRAKQRARALAQW